MARIQNDGRAQHPTQDTTGWQAAPDQFAKMASFAKGVLAPKNNAAASALVMPLCGLPFIGQADIPFVEGIDIRAGIPKWIDEGIFLLLEKRKFGPEPLGHLFHGIAVQIQSGTFRGAVGGKLGK
jgi:hypothetical protein